MYEDISFFPTCQGFDCSSEPIWSPEDDAMVFHFSSSIDTTTVRCPKCNSETYVHGYTSQTLKDMPLLPGIKQLLCFELHRFYCLGYDSTFTESLPFRYSGTRITNRAAEWIKAFLRAKVSIRTIQLLTGIHWDTIHRIHEEHMNQAIQEREVQLREEGYLPRYLAIDEFAIHKGHRYATCVMDLDTGDVLWVGKGRSKSDFQAFFEEVDPSLLVNVMAVAEAKHSFWT